MQLKYSVLQYTINVDATSVDLLAKWNDSVLNITGTCGLWTVYRAWRRLPGSGWWKMV